MYPQRPAPSHCWRSHDDRMWIVSRRRYGGAVLAAGLMHFAATVALETAAHWQTTAALQQANAAATLEWWQRGPQVLCWAMLQLLTSFGLAFITAACLLLASSSSASETVTSKRMITRGLAVPGDPKKQSCPANADEVSVRLGAHTSSELVSKMMLEPGFGSSDQLSLRSQEICVRADAAQQTSSYTPSHCNNGVLAAVTPANGRDQAWSAVKVAAVHDEDIVDVWVLAGQSNCVGYNQADGQPMPAAAAPWPDKILAYNRQCGQWHEAVPNVHLDVYGYEDADSCGPDMAFARTLITSGTSRKVGLIPTACGATNLYNQWRVSGLLWSSMVWSVVGGMAALKGRGRLRGILWIQGESDALATPREAAQYGANFTQWLAATRAALSVFHPEVPVLMAVMATRGRELAFPHIRIVAKEQQRLTLPGLLKVDMSGFEFYPHPFGEMQGQLIHLSKAGACALGVCFAYQVAATLEQVRMHAPACL